MYYSFKSDLWSTKLLNKLEAQNSGHVAKVDIAEIKKAIYCCKKYHANQKRNSGEPFYSHPLEVAYMVSNYIFKTDIIITSILHDTLEDTTLTREKILSIFGPLIADQVADLTRIKNGYKISSKELIESLWLQKKYDLLLIKLIDRLHNMQTIHAKPIDKIQKTVTETVQSFIAFAMHAQFKDLETIMYQLCLDALAITHYGDPNATTDPSHLSYLEDTDIHQFVSQVFQSVTIPIESKK